jgi:3-hydroxy-9,10-secoandrosta-1,3,5(10)-triene-9,17-dione monooxygenase
MRAFLLPRADYTIDRDAWHVFGLQGTGSHDVIVDDVFVPEHRTHRSIDGFLCTNPGQETNTGALYTLPWAQVFMRSVSTAAFGGARAAINAAIEIAQSRVSTNTGKASKNDPFLMAAISKAHAQVIEMEQTLRLTFEDLMGYAERGETIPMEKRTLYAYNSASVVRRMAELVDGMMELLGGRAIYTSSPIIQPWLDLHAGRAHVANDPNNRTQDLVGGILGMAPGFTFL